MDISIPLNPQLKEHAWGRMQSKHVRQCPGHGDDLKAQESTPWRQPCEELAGMYRRSGTIQSTGTCACLCLRRRRLPALERRMRLPALRERRRRLPAPVREVGRLSARRRSLPATYRVTKGVPEADELDTPRLSSRKMASWRARCT